MEAQCLLAAEPDVLARASQVGRSKAAVPERQEEQRAEDARSDLQEPAREPAQATEQPRAAGSAELQAVKTVSVPVAPARLVLPLTFQSQLTEPPPGWWGYEGTPYCAAAAAIMVMGAVNPQSAAGQGLSSTFAIGRRGNTTPDLGLDPDGISYLMRAFGGEGRIHAGRSPYLWLDDVIGRLNHGVPVVALTQAGDHAVTVYGYEAIPGGDVIGLYIADPLRSYMGALSIDEWFGSPVWMGARFAAPGPRWQGSYVFVSYRDFR